MAENEKIDAVEIDDSELENVAGGTGPTRNRMTYKCTHPKCGQFFFYIEGQTSVECPGCKTVYMLDVNKSVFV